MLNLFCLHPLTEYGPLAMVTTVEATFGMVGLSLTVLVISLVRFLVQLTLLYRYWFLTRAISVRTVIQNGTTLII